MAEVTRCRYIIDGPTGTTGEGRRERPWWRRPCKRTTTNASGYCWQHEPEYERP